MRVMDLGKTLHLEGKERACLFEYLGIIYIYYVMGLSLECLGAVQLLLLFCFQCH